VISLSLSKIVHRVNETVYFFSVEWSSFFVTKFVFFSSPSPVSVVFLYGYWGGAIKYRLMDVLYIDECADISRFKNKQGRKKLD